MASMKLTSADPETKSPDLIAENISRLKNLFPELITEGPTGTAIDIDVLKRLVGDLTVTDAQPGTRFMLMAGKPYGEEPIYNGPYVD